MRGKVAAVIQARMGSTRLRGKTLMMAAGKPLLHHLIERLRRATSLDDVIVATTSLPEDDAIAALARRLDAPCFRGSSEDVLGRVCAALDCFEVETHVEVHGDGPLADWRVIDRAVAIYAGGQHHLVTNADPVTYPPGLEVWVYAADLARRLAREQHAAQYRESPVLYVMQHPDDFAVGRFEAPPALRAPELYLEVDEAADFAVLSTIIERLYPVNPAFTTEDVLALVASEPALAESNRAVFRRWKAPPPSL